MAFRAPCRRWHQGFYWGVRPKPEYGTIEPHVRDTPLHPAYAAALASYARELCIKAYEAPGAWPRSEARELYTCNRFNAAKEGVHVQWMDPEDG